MNNKVCATCGANPCYLICPTQGPWHGDQSLENDDHESNARYDDVRERFSTSQLSDNDE